MGDWLGLFPAHAGMNRIHTIDIIDFETVPRTRGDEPLVSPYLSGASFCSPHTRG